MCRGCFSKLLPPICGVNFSENILMPQVKVHMKENWNDTKFLLRLTLKKNSLLLYFYRLLRALSPTIVGKNVQIYGVQITGMNLSVKYFLCSVSSILLAPLFWNSVSKQQKGGKYASTPPPILITRCLSHNYRSTHLPWQPI